MKNIIWRIRVFIELGKYPQYGFKNLKDRWEYSHSSNFPYDPMDTPKEAVYMDWCYGMEDAE